MGGSGLSIEIMPAGSQDSTSVERREPEPTKSSSGDVQEIRYELAHDIRPSVHSPEAQSWRTWLHQRHARQAAAMISLSKPPELTPRGSLKLTYKAEDDYGVDVRPK